MEEKQKTVELISFELKNHRIIRAVKLDFEKWKESNVIEVIGDVGQGKSSFLEGLAIATTGTDHIKDKSRLETGFKTEVQIMDGEHKIYLGVRVAEISRGKNKGEPKFETYLYEKDEDGRIVSEPILDGKKATAKSYTEMLSTALTFRMDSLFSSNQTEHRKLIEELFAAELNSLGVDEIVDKIKTAKDDRDSKRHERDRLAATMESFKEEGFTEKKLNELAFMPEEPIVENIRNLEVEKGILTKNPTETRNKELGLIAEKGRNLVEEVRTLNESRMATFSTEKEKYEALKAVYDEAVVDYGKLIGFSSSLNAPDYVITGLAKVAEEWSYNISKDHQPFLKMEVPTQPVIIPIVSGKLDFTGIVPEEYQALSEKYKKIGAEYSELSMKPLDAVDTSAIDAKIQAATVSLKSVQENNEILKRFTSWKDWIEACGIYEKQVDELRKLYTKIDTGVNGLVISPAFTDSGKLEIWMEYNAEHDVKLFENSGKEYRRLYDYSKSQRAIVGVFLQAARLDKKDKALRLAVLDDYTQTAKGKKLLETICKERNLKLVISRTDDRTKLEDLGNGEFLVENGEILFE